MQTASRIGMRLSSIRFLGTGFRLGCFALPAFLATITLAQAPLPPRAEEAALSYLSPPQTTPLLFAQKGPSPLFAAGSPSAQQTNSPPESTQSDLQAIRQLEENYLRAEMEDNVALAQSILADDYVGIRPDGSSSGKSTILNNLARHDRERSPYTVTATNMLEHLFGDTACITYTKTYTRPTRGPAYSENVLHVLTKRNGVWHLQASSPLPSGRP